jgi:hypothetical protein
MLFTSAHKICFNWDGTLGILKSIAFLKKPICFLSVMWMFLSSCGQSYVVIGENRQEIWTGMYTTEFIVQHRSNKLKVPLDELKVLELTNDSAFQYLGGFYKKAWIYWGDIPEGQNLDSLKKIYWVPVDQSFNGQIRGAETQILLHNVTLLKPLAEES